MAMVRFFYTHDAVIEHRYGYEMVGVYANLTGYQHDVAIREWSN